jgi:hypothetical protein
MDEKPHLLRFYKGPGFLVVASLAVAVSVTLAVATLVADSARFFDWGLAAAAVTVSIAVMPLIVGLAYRLRHSATHL